MTPPEADDPRALAQKLAEEAKARALAKKLAEQAKARAAAPDKPAPAAPKKSLADRARKPMSAKEALRRAIEAEKAAAAKAKEAPKPAPAPAAPPPAPAPAVAAAPAAPVAPPAVSARREDASTVIAKRLPGLEAGELYPVDNREVFRALWTAHRARAQSEGDHALMITADVLTQAAERLPPGALVAARVDKDGESWAAWVDASAGIVLGMAAPADVYLAGL